MIGSDNDDAQVDAVDAVNAVDAAAEEQARFVEAMESFYDGEEGAEPVTVAPSAALADVAAEIVGFEGETDLFGAPIHERMERRIWTGSRRLEAYKARTALRQLAEPMEVAHYCMLEAFGRKDYETAHARAMSLMPYFYPRVSLQGQAGGVGGGAAGPGGGPVARVRFTWGEPQAGDGDE